jgi:pimeloyl-ACP methyl ester carboxylesterase
MSASVYEARGPHRVVEHKLAPQLPGAPAAHVVDAWLPADAPALRGLVFFSHGFGGHRRQSTFVLAHLASHGYAALSVDHHGPALPAIVAQAMAAKARGEPVGAATLFGELPVTRPRELLALLPALRAELRRLLPAAPASADTLPWAVVGHSFGAYSGLVAAARTREICAVVALAPAGGPGPVFVPAFAAELALEQLGHVHTLYLAAEHDSLVSVASVTSLWERTAGSARVLVMDNADHVHFCDHVPESHAFLRATTRMPELRDHVREARDYDQLCTQEAAHRAICGVVTAQLEVSFHGVPAAEAALAAPGAPIRCLRQRRGSSPTP